MEALSSSELESNRQLVLLVSHQQSSADRVWLPCTKKSLLCLKRNYTSRASSVISIRYYYLTPASYFVGVPKQGPPIVSGLHHLYAES